MTRKFDKSYIADLAEKMKARGAVVVSEYALEVATFARDHTPVDTGKARDNWKISTGSPDTSVNEAGSGQNLESAVLSLNLSEPLFITNATPYIGELENGHSKQAPQGMVRGAAINAAAQLDRFVRDGVRINEL